MQLWYSKGKPMKAFSLQGEARLRTKGRLTFSKDGLTFDSSRERMVDDLEDTDGEANFLSALDLQSRPETRELRALGVIIA